MYAIFAPLIGALITAMNGINSVLAARTGAYVSVLVIHVAGLAVVCLVCLFARNEKASGERLPFWYYGGGFVGVGTVFACNAAFAGLGASLAVALALLGQTLGSLAVDATGFLGRKKYPLSVRKLPGVIFALIGIFIMAGNREGKLGFMAVAFLSGILPLLSFILNSQLALAKGIWKSARTNYIVGLAMTLALFCIVRPELGSGLSALPGVGVPYIVGGGILGVVMTGATNFFFPKIPALWSTLLMFAGQALTGVVIDAVSQGSFPVAKFAGTMVMLAGLGINTLLDRKAKAP
ncbi:MAG: DMT family transporter [Rectinemataceae bacterium]